MMQQLFLLFCLSWTATVEPIPTEIVPSDQLRLDNINSDRESAKNFDNEPNTYYNIQMKQENNHETENFNEDQQLKNYQTKRTINAKNEKIQQKVKGLLHNKLNENGDRFDGYLKTKFLKPSKFPIHKLSAPLKPKIPLNLVVGPRFKKILLPPKIVLPKHHPGLLGSRMDSDDDDNNPESIILQQILSSSRSGNEENFKNALLTKTTIYNVTKLRDLNQEVNFLLGKKEDVTIDMKYLDSRDRETEYSNTRSSKLNKIIGYEDFYDESIQEGGFDETDEDEDRKKEKSLLGTDRSNNKSDEKSFSGEIFKGSGRSLKPHYTSYPTEFVGGTFISSGATEENSSQAADKDMLPKSDDSKISDLLGQSNELNKLYQTHPTVGTTITDFTNDIEKNILAKGSEGSSTYLTEHSSELTTLQGEPKEINEYDELSTRTPEVRNSEVIIDSKFNESTDLTEPVTDIFINIVTSTPLTIEDSIETTNDNPAIIIKNGESLVLRGMDNQGITELSLSTQKHIEHIDTAGKDTSTTLSDSFPTDKTEQTTEEGFSTGGYSAKITNSELSNKTTKNIHKLDDSDENKFEDRDPADKSTLKSILVTDPQTEEASTEVIFLDNVTESSDYDRASKTIENGRDKLIGLVLQEDLDDLDQNSTEEDKVFETDSTATYPTTSNDKGNENKSNISKEDDEETGQNDDDTIFLGKPKDNLTHGSEAKDANNERTLLEHNHPKSGKINSSLFNEEKEQDYEDSSNVSKETTELSNEVTAEASAIDLKKIRFEGSDLIIGSVVDNEVNRDDTTTSHAVELWGGNDSNKGQQVTSHDEDWSKPKTPSPNSKTNIESEESTEEILTELCFPLKNEKEVSLYELLAGNLYLETEGRKVHLKIQPDPMKNCNSGTKKCKLPIDFAKSGESSRDTNSTGEDFDEMSDTYSSVKVRKRQVESGDTLFKNSKEEVEVKSVEDKPKILDISVTKDFSLEKQQKNKNICLTDWLLGLLASQASSKNRTRNTNGTHDDAKNLVKVEPIKKEVNTAFSTILKENEPKLISSQLTSFGTIEKKQTELVSKQISDTAKESGGVLSKKRLKRTILHQSDSESGKEGGCGCSSMLGRTLPPIPSHDHFVGKRLNIITNIAHAIKDWAATAH